MLHCAVMIAELLIEWSNSRQVSVLQDGTGYVALMLVSAATPRN